MQSNIPIIEKISFRRRLLTAAVALGVISVFAFAETALAQTKSTSPLNFGDNFFVTGNYVVAGVGLRGLGDATGYATGTINMPDTNSVPAGGVPEGAQVVEAYLYWQTVESSQTAFAGQHGFFRPVFPGGPSSGYAISGTVLGNPNAPVAWSSGGCSGNAQGSKTIRTYRADVRPFLRVDSEGNVMPNGQYEVRLADSGSNGGGAPLTLGATLVIIYRILDKSVPLSSVVIYDGSFAPSNSSSDMTQTLEGYYEATAHPITKLTQIVGNGQPNKYESVSLDSVAIRSLYGTLPPFPGIYDQNTISPTGGGSWDNPTWLFPNGNDPGAGLLPNPTTTLMVAPSGSNSGCVSWGAVILSTTVKDTDHDGLLDVWEINHGYCDASVNNGNCNTGDPSWVSLPGADPNKRDIFVQMDYMCSELNPDGSCNTTDGTSMLPKPDALTMIESVFTQHGINLHLFPTNVIPEDTCIDDPSALCPFPGQPGVVGWKARFEYLKNTPLNYPDESSCEQALDGPCIRRFQHGRKDSYHYVLFANALGAPKWSLLGETLTSVVASGNTVTFTTSTPNGLVANDTVDGNGRVTVSGATTNPSLNGTYFVQSVPNSTTFTIHTASSATAVYTVSTDPDLSVASGQASTSSGMSDIGGQDSLITLGLWGADGQTVNVQAGTFMHELGHSLGLRHGGSYHDTTGSYVATLEPNCKPNYQSVMNYLFQVDLLNDNGHPTLDYSEQNLVRLNEQNLSGVTGLTTTDGTPTAYSGTDWYTPTQPYGVGTAATRHCDGTPLLPTDPSMYRVEGSTNPITPGWTDNQDINFDGKTNTSLRGYDDWANLDLRQVGATGSEVPGRGVWLGGGGVWLGGGGVWLGGGGVWLGGGGVWLGGGGVWLGGGGLSDFTYEAANSFTRPPRNLTATVIPSPNSVQLNWDQPSFGQISEYKVYRGVDSTPGTSPYATLQGGPPLTTFTDPKISCGHTYKYFVTAILAGKTPPQESVPSNLVTVTNCNK